MSVPIGALRNLSLALALALVVLGASAAQQVNTHGAAIKGFQDRLTAYLELRDEATRKLPDQKETKDPAQVNAREKAIGEAVRAARAGAKPGDLFGHDELRAFFLQEVRADWKRRRPADRKSLLSGMPKGLKVTVNMTYPPELPLGTFPSLLIERLPKLPDGLEYRFMGPHLVIRDSMANIVLDVLPNAVTTT